jgi:hypothetical protein
MASPARRSASPVEDEPIIIYTLEESRAYFDELVQRELGMSAAEFFRRFDAGEFPDSEATSGLQTVFMYYSFFDQLRH